jgi:hypothetical protein
MNDNQIYKRQTFYWSDKRGYGRLVLEDRTYEEGLKIAKSMGYTERKWYNPSTWDNRVVLAHSQ